MLSGANQAKEEKLKMRKIRVLIERDTLNKRTWDNLVPQIDTTTLGKFLEEVDREFPCMICQTRVDIPFTFPCGHNICQVHHTTHTTHDTHDTHNHDIYSTLLTWAALR
jgi:hypothetical protein